VVYIFKKEYLSGKEVEVFTEEVKTLPPFEIAGAKYYQYNDIAAALIKNKEEGKNLVFKGKLVNYLIKVDQEFAESILEISEKYSAENRLDEGLFIIAYSLCRWC
jgi:hypothetical protein